MTSSQTNRRHFQSMLSFMLAIVSVAVSESRQWQTLLLAWREDDESLTWWWQDIRRSANGNLLFLGKASFSCSQRCLQTVYFLLPPLHHYPLALVVNKSPAVYILSPALDGLWRENRGSVNRLNLGRIDSFVVWILVTSCENRQYLQPRSQGCLSSFEKEPWLRLVTWKYVTIKCAPGVCPQINFVDWTMKYHLG